MRADLRDRRGAHQHVRPHGRRPAPGLGDARRDGRAVPGRRRRRLLGRGGGQSRLRRSASSRRRCRPAATWRARRSASASPTRRCSPSITTAASCGAVNAMHDSFTPLGGLVPLVNIQLGEIIFGGVGAGLYGMLLFAILAVFIAGLMVGRTPEYLGKKIEAKEVKMAMLAILILPLVDPGLHARSPRWSPPAWPARQRRARTASARSSMPSPRPPATTARPSPASRQHAVLQHDPRASRCCIGRFLMIVPMLAIAGSLAAKKIVPAVGRHLPDPRPAVRRPAGRRDPDRRRPHLLPGPRARPDRRAPRDAGRHPLLSRGQS